MTYAGIPATTSSPFNKLCSYSSLTLRKIFMVVRASSTWYVSGHSGFDEVEDRADGRGGVGCGFVRASCRWYSGEVQFWHRSRAIPVHLFYRFRSFQSNCVERQFSFPPLIQCFRLGLLSPPPPLSLLPSSFQPSIHNWRE